jgi:phosphoglycolate phosphatase-like HAD superfamily hydrolase
MHLIVFDIDGTLTDMGTVDSECFWQTAKEIFGLPSNYPTWIEGLKDVTGLGIVAQLCEQALARKISDSEVDRFKGRLVAVLEAVVRKDTECIRALPGAAAVLTTLRSIADLKSAIATGCFLAEAELKLRRARLFDPGIPMSSCDDARSREEIMTISARKAVACYGGSFSAVTYVGDGVWDCHAGQRLARTSSGLVAAIRPSDSWMQAQQRCCRASSRAVRFSIRCHIQRGDPSSAKWDVTVNAMEKTALRVDT